MNQLVHVVPGLPEEAGDLEKALAITVALEKHYPGHYWKVDFMDHNLTLQHVAITNMVTVQCGKEGFRSLLPRDKIGTVHEAVGQAVRFAGALLEAFGLPRGPAVQDQYPVVPMDLYAAVMAGKQLRGMGKG